MADGKRAFSRLMPTRYLVVVLGSIGMGIVYGLKVNLHVAIISMVNNTALQAAHNGQFNSSSVFAMANISQDSCAKAPSTSNNDSDDGPFLWPKPVQGLLLSSYFWGYLVAQLPGGIIAEVFSAKWVMFFSVAINVVCTLFSPILSEIHYSGLLAMRIGEGLGGGVTFPAMHVMLAHWAPPAERSVMSSIVYSGTALGTVVSMLVSGVIAGSMGWEAVFYLQGGACCIWLFLWALLVEDSPEKQGFISDEEKTFIVNSLKDVEDKGKEKVPRSTPWKAIATSPAFLAILVAHVCSNWGWYMVLIELPLYLKDILGVNIKESAILTATPFLCMWLFSMFLSKTIDSMRAKNRLSTTAARKLSTLIASVVPLVCFIFLSYIGCRKILAVVVMTLAVTAIGGMFSGFLSNHIDIAPNYAGTLMAITNTLATIPGILVPNFVSHLTELDPSMTSWRIIFWTTVVLYVVEIIVYSSFGSGEVQKWNHPPSQDNIEEQPLNATSPLSEPKSYDSTTRD